jgi:adenine-specific DNA-methyltransferase
MPSLHFKGKVFVQNHHLAVPFHELMPVKAKGLSATPSLHDNVIVNGDNLAALKALLPTYHGKVKCVYIDPPYNTGNEGWAYNDNVNSPMMRDWLGKTVDREDLTRHDKWCCMMLPRLKLLRELLRDDGAIFVSIDDNEVHRLRCLMDEVFGEENFVAMFVRRRRLATGMRENPVSPDHEFVACYARQIQTVSFTGTKRNPEDYPLEDSKGRYRSTDLTIGMGKDLRPNQFYKILDRETNEEFWPPEERVWRFEPSSMHREIKAGNIIWPSSREDGKMTRPRYKTRYAPNDEKTNPVSTWIDTGKTRFDEDDVLFVAAGLNTEATKQLRTIFGEQVFAYPKPVSLVEELVRVSTDKGSIVLDSFAGSGTTAHAVLALNNVDGGKRKFVLVECEDYADTITAERVRRVIKGVPSAKDEALKAGLGGTFSFFKLGKPMRQESLLDGTNLPDYEALAAYVFFTATGEEWEPKRMKKKEWHIGESRLYDVFLFYEPEVERLKDLALTLDVARKLPSLSGKNKLVFAPTKYLDQEFLDRYRITFCQLPFQIYRAVDGLAAKAAKDTKA